MKLKFHVIILIAFALLCRSCRQSGETALSMQQYVVFSISQVDPFTLKTGEDVECPLDVDGNLLQPTVAEIVIDGVTYHPGIYFIGGKLYTQSIKLNLPGGNEVSYNVTHFALLDAVGGTVIMATPGKNSYYADFVEKAVDFDISVGPFGKAEISVQVLCFVVEAAAFFGFELQGSYPGKTATTLPI